MSALAAVVSAGVALTVPVLTSAQAADPKPARIAPGLEKKLEQGSADFWVRMSAEADLAGATRIEDWEDRGEAVVEALQERAERSQRGAVQRLKADGATYETFWATNAILVRGGSAKLARSLATTAGVSELRAPQEYGDPEPVTKTAATEPQSIEWGVKDIHADQVWAGGDTGKNIVVANVDTGVQFDHPALVKQYRGNNGDGTFDHDYNWFDVSSNCETGPCDTHGHGTHTMGTMVGSDGGENQIGVAPGATWISANGCDSCSDADLVKAGEWMLAPTRVDGTDPDPGMRPNIVNNSWGSEQPSNDPFLEDVSVAWAAAGIFSVWSNGNSGPSCNTSTSPGSRTVNYSVGAYGRSGQIAGFSSRGSGQDGAVKPDISAPGAAVRSAQPGSTYGDASGTSMAAPHVAGSVALLWSAHPELVGDIDTTRALLDETARDTADLQCGGTADDNNVHGEGRLDALALVEAGNQGPTGELTGAVTDADGAALSGARLHIVGGEGDRAIDRDLTVGRTGTWSLTVPVGTYAVTASRYGYVEESATLDVGEDETVRHDFALDTAPTGDITGTITDGSGHGWPLYAKVTVEHHPEATTFTDPTTGEYAVELPEGSYELRVEPRVAGYRDLNQQVELTSAGKNLDLAVPVDDTCTAGGYAWRTDATQTDFDAGKPEGWTVVDHNGKRALWRFDDPRKHGNLTGGSGGFAVADSIYAGADTSLVSPMLDFSDYDAPAVRFREDFRYLGGETADVDVSIDGGQTWQNVRRQRSSSRSAQVLVRLPQAAGHDQVQVRFHYYDAKVVYWWEVDDVLLGEIDCAPTVAGGYVVGTVRDANTDKPVNGARVTVGETTLDVQRTPEDSEIEDGFYATFAPSGSADFAVTARNYQAGTTSVDIADDEAVWADLSLDAGRLEVTRTVSATLQQGDGPVTETISIENTGTSPSTYVLAEHDPDATTPVRAPADPAWSGIPDLPYSVMDNGVVHLDGKIYSIGGSTGAGPIADNRVYDPEKRTWSRIAPLPVATAGMAVAAMDDVIVATGGAQQKDVNPDTYVYDPAADRWTVWDGAPTPRNHAGRAVLDDRLVVVGGCPYSCGSSAGTSDVFRYDPVTDDWDQLAAYPVRASFLSCGGFADRIVCSGGTGGARDSRHAYSYDPEDDTWSRVADAPEWIYAGGADVANGQLVISGGMLAGSKVSNHVWAYDPVADRWSSLPNMGKARYRSGAACGFIRVGGSEGFSTAFDDAERLSGYDACAAPAHDVPWLTADPVDGTLEPGEKVSVDITLDGDLDQPGEYAAELAVEESTPYRVDPIGVALDVTPPATSGKVVARVSTVTCDGTAAPAEGAVVALDAGGDSWTLTTHDGTAARWVDVREGSLVAAAAKPGFRPRGAVVSIRPGKSVTAELELTELGCD
ncbi:S8 family serine peptidase [Nocardioides sp. CCNWLW239]